MGCLEMEKKALLEFKNGLVDPARRFSSWFDGDCCAWEGVRCNNKTGHVIVIALQNTNNSRQGSLGGNISHSLVQLGHVVYLDLSLNDFQGICVPGFIGSMKRLSHLNLGRAGFAGTVPWQLGELTNLRYLSLSSTVSSNGQDSLKVDDLQWLSRLSSLEHLELDNVNMPSVGETWVKVLNEFRSLSYVSLSSCSLENIPPYLPSLKFPSLVSLDISNNYFSSTIPKWLFNVTSLVHLMLGGNWFHGTVPEVVGQLTNLSTLSLSNNSLGGPVPVSLMHLVSLQTLYLNDNQFNGSVPSSLGQLSKLVLLDIETNFLQGDLSEIHFSNLRHMKRLMSRQNSLVLKFPTWIRTQKNLVYLNLTNAGISDVIPDWFGEVTSNLGGLRLAHNLIYGRVPKSMKLPMRAKVDLKSNQLEGTFPFSSFNFGLLDLSDNRFSGPIPQSIGKAARYLQYLSLSGNFFNGSIPVSIGRLQRLMVLDLSRNQLTGNIPTSLGNCSNLKVLDLDSNDLSGEIPMSFSHLTNLQTMHLSNNSLSGEVPSLISCRNLLMLNLGENELSGNIPTWLGESLSSLIVLRLRSNNFSGSIPPQLSYLTSLQILDLADNNLSGPIPPSFNNFTSMAEIDKINRDLHFHAVVYGAGNYYEENVLLVTKGMGLKYTRTLSLVTAMDISGNNLSGEVPESLMTLSGLRVLNLSGNYLAGNIPKNIGSLSTMESLDISNNRLFGDIPPSIADLYHLVGLNVSNNNLSGMIPLVRQLQTLTDPSIYTGNPFLCGFPLQKSCEEETPTIQPDVDEDEGGEEFWFYANIGCGFVTGIMGLFTVLSIRKRWMDVYLQFLDEIIDEVTAIGKLIYVKVFGGR
ncbi:receptor-like protein EIX1 [Magnolia sinica]|uniref:receptor-like protein EIX1 n=1 Tax=Magnolia sinica TaxID=86752 RepID=UPI00265800C5|nr:receptor-like protein EIX1 [Magnolia sinica]